MSARGRALVVLAALGTSACVVSTSTRPRQLALSPDGTYGIDGAVKAHLVDGSTVVFPRGARVDGGALLGEGQRFAPTLAPMGATTRVPLDSLLGAEAYTRRLNPGRTALYAGAELAAASAVAVVSFYILVFALYPIE